MSAPRPSANWQDSLDPAVRNNLVHKLVVSIVPGVPVTSLDEPRLQPTVSYARAVENHLFAISTSRSEYFHKLAEKIYTIQRELQRIRQENSQEGIFAEITSKMRNL